MAASWKIAGGTLDLRRPLGAGIVNVTTDSMFEGARSGTPEQAVEDGVGLAAAGFDMLDLGAVAARSGPPVPPADEAGRLIPAVEKLVVETGLPVSVDTFSAEVGRAALAAGAVAINDISGAADPALMDIAAETGCGLVLMHTEGPAREERPLPGYEDPVAHLLDWFGRRIAAAEAAGVDPEQIVLDPGLDFDLGVQDDLEILRRLAELRELGRPLYVSLSRKDFLGAVLAGSWDGRQAAEEREWATAAATALATAAGGSILRLHDASALQAMRIATAIDPGSEAEVELASG